MTAKRYVTDTIWFIGFMLTIACIALILSGALRAQVTSDLNKMWSVTLVRR